MSGERGTKEYKAQCEKVLAQYYKSSSCNSSKEAEKTQAYPVLTPVLISKEVNKDSLLSEQRQNPLTRISKHLDIKVRSTIFGKVTFDRIQAGSRI